MTASTRLIVMGASHEHADLELREQLHLGVDEAARLARRLAGAEDEALALSTCNRTELYLASCDIEAAAARARVELARLAELPAASLDSILEVRTDEEAAAHLFRVAGGLASMVTGETEILGQLRAAHAGARAIGATGPVLNRLFDHAVQAGRHVRSETAVAQSPASLPAAATQLAAALLSGFENRRALVIGAGRMAQLVGVNLRSRAAGEIVIVNRTAERAHVLARRVGGRVARLDDLPDELRSADVVLSATSAPASFVSRALVASALGDRRGAEPLLLVDIGVPRNVDPRIAGLPGCSLYDVDDLEGIVQDSVARRRGEALRAEDIVREETVRFQGWHRSLDVVPTIVALRQCAEDIRAEALARYQLGTLSRAEHRAVEMMTSRIVSKLLHAPIVELKRVAGLPEGELYASTLEHLFGLEIEGEARREEVSVKPGDFAGASANCAS
jgi:glutamyl-tRNA reductase